MLTFKDENELWLQQKEKGGHKARPFKSNDASMIRQSYLEVKRR